MTTSKENALQRMTLAELGWTDELETAFTTYSADGFEPARVVAERLRALVDARGVVKHLAASDEPLFVAADPDHGLLEHRIETTSEVVSILIG